MKINPKFYKTLCTVRRFEETVLENFPKGVFFGTTHTCLGQEANAVGVLSNIQTGDIVFSNHRCHGHFIAYGGDLRSLFAELMGKSTGVCGGRGGSQHLQWRNFYSNGIQGGIVPVATGMALAEKRKKTDAIVVCFLGDGTLGQGVVYESFNMASLWGIPVLYVLEDNHIAQTTPTGQVLAGGMIARFRAFGISTVELDTSDLLEIAPVAADLMDNVRTEGRPRALILHTHRFGSHSKGDDTRDPGVVARLQESRDPLKIHAARLDPADRKSIEAQVENEVIAAYQQALDDPFPNPVDLVSLKPRGSPVPSLPPLAPVPARTVLESINTALHQAMREDERVLLLGEDILDPYGGAFKVTRGLSTSFPKRVIPTPISEAGFVGLAAGMAMRGQRPVVEIMFGDFLTLAADQIVNHLAKFRWMYNDQVRVPLVIRTPMGGRRGYGPTHSQTLEKMLLGVPGLRVLAPCALQIVEPANGSMSDAGQLLLNAIFDDDPVLFIENKLLYSSPIVGPDDLPDFDLSLASCPPAPPAFRLSVKGAPAPALTLATYGHMAEFARQAMLKLAYEDEIFTEMIVVTQLSPFELEPVHASASRTQHLLTLEEGTHTLGWGTEVLAQTAEKLGPGLKSARRLAASDLPIPSSGFLEQDVLPGVDDIVRTAKDALL